MSLFLTLSPQNNLRSEGCRSSSIRPTSLFFSSPEKSPNSNRFSPYKRTPKVDLDRQGEETEHLQKINKIVEKATKEVEKLTWKYRSPEGGQLFLKEKSLKPLVRHVKSLQELQKKVGMGSLYHAAFPLLEAYNKKTLSDGLEQFNDQLIFESRKLTELQSTGDETDELFETTLLIEQLTAKIAIYQKNDPYYCLEHFKIMVNIDQKDDALAKKATVDEVATCMFFIKLYEFGIEKNLLTRPNIQPRFKQTDNITPLKSSRTVFDFFDGENDDPGITLLALFSEGRDSPKRA